MTTLRLCRLIVAGLSALALLANMVNLVQNGPALAQDKKPEAKEKAPAKQQSDFSGQFAHNHTTIVLYRGSGDAYEGWRRNPTRGGGNFDIQATAVKSPDGAVKLKGTFLNKKLGDQPFEASLADGVLTVECAFSIDKFVQIPDLLDYRRFVGVAPSGKRLAVEFDPVDKSKEKATGRLTVDGKPHAFAYQRDGKAIAGKVSRGDGEVDFRGSQTGIKLELRFGPEVYELAASGPAAVRLEGLDRWDVETLEAVPDFGRMLLKLRLTTKDKHIGSRKLEEDFVHDLACQRVGTGGDMFEADIRTRAGGVKRLDDETDASLPSKYFTDVVVETRLDLSAFAFLKLQKGSAPKKGKKPR
jgi:hypothetical protein